MKKTRYAFAPSMAMLPNVPPLMVKFSVIGGSGPLSVIVHVVVPHIAAVSKTIVSPAAAFSIA
jgi:hypothetical protein